MGDVDEGEPREWHVCLVCQQPSSEEGNYSEKRPFIPNTFSMSLKMAHGLHTATLQRNLARGKGADDAPDNRHVAGDCRGVPASCRAAHTLRNQRLRSWRVTKSLCRVFWQLSCFPGKKIFEVSGLCLLSSGIFPLV